MGKDIDSIYRDRFKGAKVPPPEDSWENILSQLPQKREKRKLFPLWFQISGVAAALALIFAAYLQSPTLFDKKDDVVVTPVTKELNMIPLDASETFNEVMRESEIILQVLILQNWRAQHQENDYQFASAREENSEKINNSNGDFSNIRHGEDAEIANDKEEPVEENLVAETNSAGELSPAVALVPKDDPDAVTLKNERSAEKFKLTTRIAPVYFSNMGNGNALNNSFSPKEASGQVTFSYGVNVAYKVSEKINIRSGLNKVDLEYNTREVSFNDVAATNTFASKMAETTTLSSPSNGTLSQKMGFLEVPLEVEYVLINEKFAFGIIGGGSILFLEENELLLDFPDNKANLGETNNMNNLSYTTNLGLSMGYNLSKQLQLSLEPVVKFQMNTFRSSEGQTPYFFGLYSGFSYKF
ncbi:PorT family protein [Salinimicrobium sediminilitoris]|uniref:PorT family protein n=1 Tax=Salinimicrobium sediminilitoris TaxID=2876715 RepID=UPI001E3D8DB1|nr:PorT family protein [Salinimicrobium sediminilitoris]MCC8359697.1 PorT family protein [Salinimicrobium sediminilitoris]